MATSRDALLAEAVLAIRGNVYLPSLLQIAGRLQARANATSKRPSST